MRTITFSTRLAWGTAPNNNSLQLVSNLFLNAGIPILYIINLVFTHRITRAQHPRFGWHKSLSILGRITIALIFVALILLIYAGIHSAYVNPRNFELHDKLKDIILAGSTFNTMIAVLPLPMLLLGVIIPKRVRTEKFGQGRFRVKVAVLLTSSSLLTLRAVWATAAAYKTPVPLQQPIPWYYQKVYFYTIQLFTELLVVYLFIFVRINRIFYTPDGLPRGSYVDLPKSTAQLELGGNNPPPYAQHHFPTTTTLRVYSEEELFEDHEALAGTLGHRYSSTSLLLDNQSGKFRLDRHGTNDDIYSPTSYAGSSRRYSAGSHYYYDGASGDNSRAVSIYAPSTYDKKDRRDSTSGRSGQNSPRWGPGEGKGEVLELQRFSYAPQGEMTEMPPSLRAGSNQYRQSAPVFDEAQTQRIQAVSSNFQDRVNQVMQDANAHSMSHTGASTPTGRHSRPHSVTHSPQRSRANSFDAPPVPPIDVARPDRVVSQPQRSPALLQSFEEPNEQQYHHR